MTIRQSHKIEEGFACTLNGKTPNMWNALVLKRPDHDAHRFNILNRNNFNPKSEEDLVKWRGEVTRPAETLQMLTCREGETEVNNITHEGKIVDFHVTGSDRPAALWVEFNTEDRTYTLMLGKGDEKRAIFTSHRILRSPTASGEPDDLSFFFSTRRDRRDICIQLDAAGKVIREFEGRHPVCAELPGDNTALFLERTQADNSIRLFMYIIQGNTVSEYPVPGLMGQNVHADAVFDPSDEKVFLVFETFPLWGADEMQGRYREIGLLNFDINDGSWSFGPGTGNGILPVAHKACLDSSSAMNQVPLNPRILMIEGAPAVSYQHFRFVGAKGLGWDLILTRLEGSGWTEPVQLTQNRMIPDTGYGIIADGTRCLCLAPTCEHQCMKSFEESLGGRQGHCVQAITRYRVEIFEADADEAPLPVGFPDCYKETYHIPHSMEDIAPEVPGEVFPSGQQIIWGDIHAHCIYSKCMSANDGFPADVLRYQRDFLGCRVLCLTDHVEYMNSAEFHHVMDSVEAEAGHDCIPLYGVEWAKAPAHHTNFYAIDREIFGKLRSILLEESHLLNVYERIRDELPERSVAANRHFHGQSGGEYGRGGSRVTSTHDPEFERAMEAMQTRGNKMSEQENRVAFPTDFLNSGAKIGLVGGSDHSRGGGPNKYCLTGFVVDEPTQEAVFHALLNRKTVATANGKIAVGARLGEAEMGDEITHSGAVSVKAAISGARPLRRACLIRNGIYLGWEELDGNAAEICLTDPEPPQGPNWYSVTVIGDSAYLGLDTLAHSSPIFVKQR